MNPPPLPNREIIDYVILEQDCPDNLTNEIRRFLAAKKGWQPFGSPYCQKYVEDRPPNDTLFLYGQAMVKYK
jgi:hypothetical protein